MGFTNSCDGIKAILDNNKLNNTLPLYSNEDLWKEAYERKGIKDIIRKAEQISEEPIPNILYSHYKEFERSGKRDSYEISMHERHDSLCLLVTAECIERKGRFLDAIQDYLWAICEETTWVAPAHCSPEIILLYHKRGIDLYSAMGGMELAEIKVMLSDVLDPAIKRRISLELEKRLFGLFMDNEYTFNKYTNNWNAVCHCGVICAAILEDIDTERLAKMIYKTLLEILYYLKSFDSDGCTAEGVGYWGYGFEYFVRLADILLRRTGSEINLFELDPKIPKVARFAVDARLSGDKFVNFADCVEETKFKPLLIELLHKHFNMPEIHSLPVVRDKTYKTIFSNIPEGIRPKYKRNVFFRGFNWMISRTDESDESALIFAIKGGNNNEAHNHNDCGTFIIHSDEESFIADLGTGHYTRDHFTDKRYTILTTRSLGHNVPFVNGYEQPQGEQYHAVLLDYSTGCLEDRIAFELSHAYPEEAGVESLVRSARLVREGTGYVEIIDEICFRSGKTGTMADILLSFNKMTVTEKGLRISGKNRDLLVLCDGSIALTEIELLENAVNRLDVYRARFTMQEGLKGKLHFKFMTIPEEA